MAQEELNRSGALSPEAHGMINSAVEQSVKTAVQESVAAIFASLAPTLKDMALTPEKIKALTTPYVDPLKIARDKRESQRTKDEESERIRRLEQFQANCPHYHKNNQTSINLVHNFHDGRPRGICVLCHSWIHGKEWRIRVNPETGASEAYYAQPHKDYPRVLAQDQAQTSA